MVKPPLGKQSRMRIWGMKRSVSGLEKVHRHVPRASPEHKPCRRSSSKTTQEWIGYTESFNFNSIVLVEWKFNFAVKRLVNV